MMRRRDFLCLSAGVAASATLGSTPLPGRGWRVAEASPRTAAAEPISLGYWRGSDRLPGLANPIRVATAVDLDPRLSDFRPDVVPAERLASGDPALLATGAWLTIHGLFEAETPAFQPRLGTLSLEVDFEILGAGEARTVRCLAWRHEGAPVRNAGAPVRMRVPLGSVAGLRLSVERGDAPRRGPRAIPVDGGATTRGDACLSVGREPARPKLRRGVYFLATRAPRPAWELFQFREVAARDTGMARGLVRTGLLGLEPAPFDYLVVSIDAGDAGAEARG